MQTLPILSILLIMTMSTDCPIINGVQACLGEEMKIDSDYTHE